MTIQPINLGGAVLLFLLSLAFIGPMYIAVVSLILSLYIIIAFFDMENDLLKNTVDTENHTIMTRSRRRLLQQRNI
jgi:hypothetical protein